jgi:pantoate--beta-alanine ligase
MKMIRSVREMQEVAGGIKRRSATIGFVPTMGALHEGHLSLIRKAGQDNDTVVVSIFVNPAQFGPKEDYHKYHRDLNKDAKLCQKEGVDIVFYPDTNEMYPDNYQTYVTVEGLSGVLCGRFRPGHFKGVATVVTKLFDIVHPDSAYFGQKDAQQAIIIKKLIRDLNMPMKIKIMPTVREKDGLAMSSRNIYLSKNERQDATVLYQSLNLARHLIKKGTSDSQYIIRRMKDFIARKKSAKVDYIEIVDLNDLRPARRIKEKSLIVLAVWIGKTRLIDNIVVNKRIR